MPSLSSSSTTCMYIVHLQPLSSISVLASKRLLLTYLPMQVHTRSSMHIDTIEAAGDAAVNIGYILQVL